MVITPKIFVEYSSENNQTDKIELTQLLLELRSIINEHRVKSSQQNDSSINDPLLSITEIAQKLNKSESTVRNWKREGIIPFQRAGRSIFFSERDVKQALKSLPVKIRPK